MSKRHSTQHDINKDSDLGQQLYLTQRRDYLPNKSSRDQEQPPESQEGNWLSANEEEHRKLFSLNSPQSTLRMGDEQRKILLDGKKNMDLFAHKYVDEDSDYMFNKYENQDNSENIPVPIVRQSFSKNNNQNAGCFSNAVMEFSNVDEIRSTGALVFDKEYPKNKPLELANFSNFKSNNHSNNDKRRSLFVESVGQEQMRNEVDVRSMKSFDYSSQLDFNQLSISPTKNYGNNNAHQNNRSLLNQNSYTNSYISKLHNIPLNYEVSGPLNQLNDTPLDQTTLKKDSKDEEDTQNGFRGVWKKKSLIIIYLARKFMVDIKKYSSSWRYRNLSLNQFQTINDASCDEEQFIVNSTKTSDNLLVNLFMDLIRKNKTLTKFIMHNFVIIRPDSPFKLLWDIFILMILFINIFYIPIKICFTGSHQLNLSALFHIILYDLPGWSFMLDSVIRANTAYYQKGQLITQKSKILWQYYKESFFLDLFIIIPFLLSLSLTIPFIDVVFLLRLTRLMSIMNNFEQMLNLSQKRSAIFGLVKLILTMALVAHFCGCSFFYAGTYHLQSIESINSNSQDLESWVQKEGIINKSFQEKYTTCFYWATITMITVGYGDIVPNRVAEKQLIILLTFISCGVYAYSINVIGIIIQDITKEKQILKKKLSVLNSYMKKRGISSLLQEKVKIYFNYMHEEDLKFNEGGEIFFNEVKGQLKIDVLSEIYYKVLNQSKLFRMNFSQGFLQSLSLVMEEQKYLCDEVILDIGQECNNLYFISRGEVSSLIDGGNVIGNHFKGTIFDEISFFSEGKSSIRYKSNGITTIVYVQKEKFLSEIKKYPKDYEKYCMMRDKIVLYNQYKNFGQQCQLCSSFKHTIRDCLFVNPQFNHKKILYSHNKVVEQVRNPTFQRKQRTPSLCEFKENVREVRDLVIQYLIDYNPCDETPQDLLNIVQQIVEYDNVETGLYKSVHHTNHSAQLIQDNPPKMTPDIGFASKKISFTNFQDLDSESQQNDQSPINNNNNNNNRRYKQYGQGRSRQQSSVSSLNNDTTPSQTTTWNQSLQPHSSQIVFQKPQQYQTQKLKQIDENEEQNGAHENNSNQYQQQSVYSNDKFLHLPTDTVSNNLPITQKQRYTSQITQNSQKALHKQTSKNSYFLNDAIQQGINYSQQLVNKNEQQSQSARNINLLIENSLFQEQSMRIAKNQVYTENWQNIRQNFMVIDDFDKHFPFQIYFPENNMEKVLIQQMQRRKTVQNTLKIHDIKIQEDRLKQIRSNLNLYKDRSKYRQSTKQQRSFYQLNQSQQSIYLNHHDLVQQDKNHQTDS